MIMSVTAFLFAGGWLHVHVLAIKMYATNHIYTHAMMHENKDGDSNVRIREKRANTLVSSENTCDNPGEGQYLCTCTCKTTARFGAAPIHFGKKRANPRCWLDGTVERERFWCSYLRAEVLPKLPDEFRVLHLAPEAEVARVIMSAGNQLGKRIVSYVTGDLNPWVYGGVKSITGTAPRRLDLNNLDLPNATFDLVVCSHVLEHIPDDAKAMAELFRVMKSGAIGLITAPFVPAGCSTFEDSTVVTRQQRKSLFGQFDHVRIYGEDFPQRLKRSGFGVEVVRISDWFRTKKPAWTKFKNPEFQSRYIEAVTVCHKQTEKQNSVKMLTSSNGSARLCSRDDFLSVYG